MVWCVLHGGTMARWHDGTMARWHDGTSGEITKKSFESKLTKHVEQYA